MNLKVPASPLLDFAVSVTAFWFALRVNAKIDAAESEATIMAAVTEAKAAMDALKTAEEMDAEQLKTWRTEAKAEVQEESAEE